MEKSLLDTDILSELLRGRSHPVVQRAVAYYQMFGSYTISAITVMEVVKGWHRLQRENRIQEFLSDLSDIEVLPLDIASAETAGRIYGDLERVGQPIGYADCMIAAIALQHGLTLVTGNTSHYQRIQGLSYNLQLDNWRV